MDVSWNNSKLLDTEEGLDGKLSSPEWMMLEQLSVQTEYHVIRTVAREPNLTALESTQSLFEEQNKSVDSGKKQLPCIKAPLHKSDFVRQNEANYTPT
jgi:hypothetical protein